jgi:adenosine deaminase
LNAHLHCHLEPVERKWRQLGCWSPGSGGPTEFFERHSVSALRRPRIDLDDLREFLLEVHSEQAREGFEYVELRIAPRRLLLDGCVWPDVLATCHETVIQLRAPEIRLILLINRDSSVEVVSECEELITRGLPGAFVGVDLAGDEVLYPDVTKFVGCFNAARDAGLGITVHAGEFGDERSVWTALEELGAERIAHGISTAGSRSLAARLERDNIPVEASLTSNLATGAITSIEMHPLAWLLERNVQVCLNTDVPVYTGASIQDEWRLAASLVGINFDLFRYMRDVAKRNAFAGATANLN